MKNFYELVLFRFRNFRVSVTLHRFPNPRGPYETGADDRYYGRPYLPRYTDTWGIDQTQITNQQRADYHKGWSEEEDRKDWGHD